MKLTEPNALKQLGTIMGIWAHPDDESFLAAGLFKASLLNGQNVVCVTATKGEGGVQDSLRWPPEKLADIRTKELKQALDLIGVKTHHWLGYRDGQCAAAGMKGPVDKIVRLINKYQPDTIITFGPDGMTGHSDHIAVSEWANAAAAQATFKASIYHAVIEQNCYNKYLAKADKKLNIFFNTTTPPVKPATDCQILLRLNKEQLSCKIAALKVMESQTAAIFDQFDEKFIENAWGTESFVLARSGN